MRALHCEARLIVASHCARLLIADEHLLCGPDRGDQDETGLQGNHQAFM
jgi:hypothetical protein